MAKTAKKPATKVAKKPAKPAKVAKKAAKAAKPAKGAKAAKSGASELRKAAEIAAELEQERAARKDAEAELSRATRASDPTLLQKLEEQLAEAQAKLSKRESELAVAKAEPGYWLRCPKCGGTLTEISYSGVKVDRCEACNGIFFDAGEVEQLVASADKSPEGDTAKAAGWFRGLFKKKPATSEPPSA